MAVRKITLLRQPFAAFVTLQFEDGSSERLSHEAAFRRLLREGVKNPEKPLDYVWNFHKAVIELTTP